MRCHAEKYIGPRRGSPQTVSAVLRCRQSEQGGEAFWDAEQFDRDATRGRAARIASEACWPSEAIMRSLGPRQRRRWKWKGGRTAWFHPHLQPLIPYPHTNAPMNTPVPVAPEDRLRTDGKGMQQHTHLARFGGRTATPLTLLTQGTGTTPADAGRIHHTQAPIAFSASLMGDQRLASRTTERAIRLERNVLTGKAPCFPRRTHVRGSIARGGNRVWWSGRRTLGRADWIRMQLMSQLQAEVPDPLRDDLPALLARCGVACPAVWVEFLIFVGQRVFKRTAMQIQRHNISGSERMLRQVRQEEFIHHA